MTASSRMPNTRQKSFFTNWNDRSMAANDVEAFQHDEWRREGQLRPEIDQHRRQPEAQWEADDNRRSGIGRDPDPEDEAENCSDQQHGAHTFEKGEADQRPEPPFEPSPRFTDRDACAEDGPADDDGKQPAQQDRRQPARESAGEARQRRPEQHADGHFLCASQRRRELTGDCEWSDREHERQQLGRDDDDRRQAQRGLRVGADVGDSAVEDVGQAERPQRDDSGLESRG